MEGSLAWLSEPGWAWVKEWDLYVGKASVRAREGAHTQELDGRSNVRRTRSQASRWKRKLREMEVETRTSL